MLTTLRELHIGDLTCNLQANFGQTPLQPPKSGVKVNLPSMWELNFTDPMLMTSRFCFANSMSEHVIVKFALTWRSGLKLIAAHTSLLSALRPSLLVKPLLASKKAHLVRAKTHCAHVHCTFICFAIQVHEHVHMSLALTRRSWVWVIATRTSLLSPHPHSLVVPPHLHIINVEVIYTPL